MRPRVVHAAVAYHPANAYTSVRVYEGAGSVASRTYLGVTIPSSMPATEVLARALAALGTRPHPPLPNQLQLW